MPHFLLLGRPPPPPHLQLPVSCRAAEAAQQRSGATITPVFLRWLSAYCTWWWVAVRLGPTQPKGRYNVAKACWHEVLGGVAGISNLRRAAATRRARDAFNLGSIAAPTPGATRWRI